MDASVRPRLRRDTYLIPTEGGARMLTNRGSDSFEGASIHQWIERLSPYLDGRTTVGALTSTLTDDRRLLVERIVATLMDRGLVRDAGLDHDRPELDYLDSFTPTASVAYQGFRDAHLLVTGDGPGMDEVVAELADVLTLAGACRVTVAALADALPQGSDLVVCAVDGSLAGRTLRLERACQRAEVPLVLGVRDRDSDSGVRGSGSDSGSDELWISVSPCWESLWRRRHGWRGQNDGGEAAFTDRPVTGGPLGPAVAAVVASALGMTAFRVATGVEAGVGTATCLSLDTLRTTTHRYLPHLAVGPRRTGPSAAELMERLQRLRTGPALEPGELDAAGAVLLDERLGVLGEVSERDFAQLPLNVAAVTVSSPPRLVTGAGPTMGEARWRAVLAGIAGYCATALDPARLTGPTGRAVAVGRARPVDDATRLAGRRLWGCRLADGRPRLVAATAVFDADMTGVAARYDWAGAVSAGLFDHCARLTAASVTGAVGLLDPYALRPDDEALAYLEMLAVLGVAPRVYDVTGPLRVPTLAFVARGRTIAYVSAPQPADALADGLRAVLLDEQSSRAGQPEYAPPPVRQLSLDTPDVGFATPPDGCTVAQVVSALVAAGLDPVVVPLDHDPAVHDVLPYVARVVMVGA